MEALLVESGMEHGNEEVSEVRGAFVHLQPADHAVVGQILRDTRLRNAEVIGKPRSNRLTATHGTTAKKIRNRHTQGLACFHVIIGA